DQALHLWHPRRAVPVPLEQSQEGDDRSLAVGAQMDLRATVLLADLADRLVKAGHDLLAVVLELGVELDVTQETDQDLLQIEAAYAHGGEPAVEPTGQADGDPDVGEDPLDLVVVEPDVRPGPQADDPQPLGDGVAPGDAFLQDVRLAPSTDIGPEHLGEA